MYPAGHDEDDIKRSLGTPAQRVLNMATAMIDMVKALTLPNGDFVRIRLGGCPAALCSRGCRQVVQPADEYELLCTADWVRALLLCFLWVCNAIAVLSAGKHECLMT